MGEIKVGDKLWTSDGRTELTVYHVSRTTIKAAAGGGGGYPDFTVGKRSLVPVGKWARYGALLRSPDARERRLAQVASEWISRQLACGKIAAKDVIRLARMLGWEEAGNGRA